MRKIGTFFFFLLCSAGIVSAQDIHYSQFYASPLTLNPALTGVNDCNFRVGLMYRNQWSSISSTSAFVTPSISFDINNLAAKLIRKGVASAGILILNDKAGDGVLTNLSVLGSVAYLRSLDAEKKMNVSLGLQFGFVQKWFDLSKLSFEEQYINGDFVPGLPTGESNLNTKKSYLNVNFGGLYTYKPLPILDLYVGAAGFNLISPKETFYTGGDNNLSPRIVVHAGAKIALNQKLDLMPMVLYMTQAKASEFNIGAQLGYKIQNATTDFTLYFGGYYRLGDAIIAMIGGEYKKVRLGISYDINTSSLNAATGGAGGFEISLSYVGCIGGLILDKPVLWCPRF